jgi:hypothetical protein
MRVVYGWTVIGETTASVVVDDGQFGLPLAVMSGRTSVTRLGVILRGV